MTERPAGAQEPNTANVVAARRHFDRARGLYARGAYREAVAELEAARALDPSAKDLVFNLGVVHEKLGDIDDALQWFHLYTTMDLTPPERERAGAYVRRLEGAKNEVPRRPAEPPAPTPGPPTPGADVTQPPPVVHGRMDGATITAIAVSGVALGFGTFMGIKSLHDRPSDFVTGQDGSYADLQDRTDTAHREAIAADVGFGVGVAAAITAAVLYFGRTRTPEVAGDPPPARVSVRPLPVLGASGGGGGAVIVQGSW